eukprot:287263_1
MRILLVTLLLLATTIPSEFVEISTPLGRIQGNVKHNIDTATNVYEFLGIQFGQAPVGNLRFRQAQLNESWNRNITYNATNYGPMCIQPGKSYVSENCLNLNIWSPNINSDAKLPVMIWIYGGGFVGGSGSDNYYDMHNLVSNQNNIVIVTINYRMGPLGLLVSEQLLTEDSTWKSYGGLGILLSDQITAISWVNKYIGSFGGDPNKITLFGESAGALSICMLLISPKIIGDMFQRAIIQSGSCTGSWGPVNISEGLNATNVMLNQHNWPTDINKLRKLPASEFAIYWGTTSIDGLVLTDLPSNIYSNLNNGNNVFNVDKVILGFDSTDGLVSYPWFAGSAPSNATQYKKFLQAYISNETQVNLLMNYYYPLTDFQPYIGYSNASFAWFTINGDVCLKCAGLNQISEMVKQLAQNEKYQFYVYYFRGGGEPYYAPHGSEDPYVFDRPIYENPYFVPWDQALSNAMESSWVNFGKYGIPNATTNDINVEWKPFNIDGNVMILDDKMRMMSQFQQNYRNNVCDFWLNEVGEYISDQICWDEK